MDCLHHPADYAHQAQNDRCDDQTADVDVEMNVSSLKIVAEGAHQRQGPYNPRNDVSNCDPTNTSGERDSQRFGKKLEKDVALVRSQGLLDADLPSTLLHRHQH